jgi:acyl dehydratase
MLAVGMAGLPRFFEDFSVGLGFRSSGSIAITSDRVKSFAAEFDPQPFHLDEDAASRNSVFHGLVASGWHTAAVAMRLIVDSDLGLAGHGLGVAIEQMRWLAPVRPGDVLRAEGAVLEMRPSRSRPDYGVVKFRVLVYDGRNTVVLHGIHVVLVRRRGARANP